MPLNSDEHLGAFDCDSDVMFEYNDIISTQKVAALFNKGILSYFRLASGWFMIAEGFRIHWIFFELTRSKNCFKVLVQ